MAGEMEARRWISDALMWMSFSQAEETWIHDPPEYPDWTLPPNHGVPADQFIRIWQSSVSINDVKKHLFWRTVEQLEAQRRSINNFLSENQFQALAPRSLVSTAMLSSEQLEALEADGLITPVEAKIANSEASQSGQLAAPEQGDNEDYDAARAVFDAVSGSDYSPHSSIASVEVHGGRFTGRH